MDASFYKKVIKNITYYSLLIILIREKYTQLISKNT